MVASSGNSMLVQFVSDGSVNGAGFKATFMTVCQILLTEPNGSFCPLDENLNGLYDVQNCTWIIRVDESKSIQLNITDIDIDARDYIQVFFNILNIYTLQNVKGLERKLEA